MAEMRLDQTVADRRGLRRDMLDTFLLGMSAGMLAAVGVFWAFEPWARDLLGMDADRGLPAAFFAGMGFAGIGLLVAALARTFRRGGRDELHRVIDRQAWIIAAFATLGIIGMAGVVQAVWDFHLPLLLLILPMLAVFVGARLVIRHRYAGDI